MSNPSRTLTRRLDWRNVFVVVGLDRPGRSDLPQSFPCPLCACGSLTVMQDHVLHAEWFNCRNCEFAGDLIEFAARVRSCSIEDVVEFLEAHQMFDGSLSDIDVSQYVTEHIDYRNRIKRFWEAARQFPMRAAGGMGTAGYRLLKRFCLSEDAYRDLWQVHGGQLFGVAQRQTVEELFAPLSFQLQDRANREGKSSRRRGGGPGKRRLFPGHDWDKVLVIAHSDLPGRIIGFTFIGRDPDKPEFVYKRANVGCCIIRPRESGLGFLDAITGSPHPRFGRFVFIFFDEAIATLLHARHLRDSMRPLPILLAKVSRDFNLLNLPPDLNECRLICCGSPQETLPLAKAHNAQISDYQITDAEIRSNLKHRDSATFLNLFQKRAVPWVSALRHLLATASRSDLDVLISRMKLTPRETNELQIGLGSEAGERFTMIEPHRIGGRTINVGTHVVEETADGWIAKRAGRERLICDRPIRIETVYRADAGDVYFDVVVQLPSAPVKVLVSERELKDSTLFDRLAFHLWKDFNHHLVFVRQKWAKLSFSLAMQLSSPETVTHADRVGWSQSRIRFQFPNFAVLSGGNIELTALPLKKAGHSVPAAALAAPSSRREAVALLSRKTPETQLIWALAACVAHNLLAGNCLGKPLGVVLDGQFALETGVPAANALGCCTVDTRQRGKSSILEFVSTACGAHDFLSLVTFGARSKPQISTAWLDDPNLRHAILPLPPYAAIAVSSHQGFVRIRSNELPQPLGPLASAAEWIIPSYLADVCRRKKLINIRARENELLCVLHDLAGWFEGKSGNAGAVLAAENVLMFDSDSPAPAFVELTEKMRCAGDVVCVAAEGEDEVGSKAPVAIIECRTAPDQPPTIQVRPWVVNEILRRGRVPAIRLDDVQADLCRRSAWLGTIEEEMGTVWLIDARWWQETIAAIRPGSRFRHSHGAKRDVPINGPSDFEFPASPAPLISNSMT